MYDITTKYFESVSKQIVQQHDRAVLQFLAEQGIETASAVLGNRESLIASIQKDLEKKGLLLLIEEKSNEETGTEYVQSLDTHTVYKELVFKLVKVQATKSVRIGAGIKINQA